MSLLVSSCAKTTGGQTGDEDALPSGDELFAELGRRGGVVDYGPAASAAALAADSERVVVGHAVALRAGRTFVERSDVSTHTVVLEFEVERTLKGPSRPSLYVEFLVGVEDSAPPAQLPDARVIAFAVPASDRVGSIEGEGRGLPEGETLYRLTTPQGLAVEAADGGFSQPLEPSDRALGDGDFDDLIEDLAAAIATDAQDAGTSDAARPQDAGSCSGELPFQPGALPADPPCPDPCVEVRATRFDAENACLDYGGPIVIACLEGAGPPVVTCVERTDDGQRFQVPTGWPFPDSTAYRLCSDDVAMTVIGAPSCE